MGLADREIGGRPPKHAAGVFLSDSPIVLVGDESDANIIAGAKARYAYAIFRVHSIRPTVVATTDNEAPRPARHGIQLVVIQLAGLGRLHRLFEGVGQANLCGKRKRGKTRSMTSEHDK